MLVLAMAITALVIPNADVNAADTVKVHVWTDSSWTKSYIYAWDSAGNPVTKAWPGTQLSGASEHGWYTFDLPTTAQKIIINNNSKQTADLVWDGSETWISVNSDGLAWIDTECARFAPAANSGVPVYVKADGWSTVNLYWWGSSPSWPGITLTEKNADGWYVYNVPSTIEGLIVNNGSQQTNDIKSFDVEKEIYITVNTSTKAFEVTSGNAIETQTPEVDPNGPASSESTPAPETTYHVVGLGGVWTASDANKMTLVDGNYVYKETLAADDYEFKVCSSKDQWYPESNVKFTVETECEITFTFNPETKEVTYDGTGLKDESAVETTYHVVGLGGVWTASDDNKMTLADGNYVYKKTLAADDYEFKVCSSKDDWYPGSNVKFTVETECEITFTFNPETKEVTYDGTGLKEEEPVETYTVKVQIPEGWTNPCWYAWDADNNNAGAWPGKALGTAVEGWYSIEVPVTMTNLIINADGVQTKDIKNLDSSKTAWVVVTGTGDDGFNVTYEAPATGDFSMVLPLVLVLFGGAMVVVASKKRFA